MANEGYIIQTAIPN